jgi:very-short-patch-repair endonuclease
MIADMRKYNAAASLGWSVIRVTPQMFEQEFENVVLWLSGCIGECGDV